MKRGQLSQEIADKYGITKAELRLMPYFQYLLMNGMPVDPRRINGEEREILSKWQKEGKITRTSVSGGTCAISKEFYNTMCEILYETYIPKVEKNGDI